MLPAVPWLMPWAFIHRHLAMTALRSSSSSFFTAFFVLAKRFHILAARAGGLQAPSRPRQDCGRRPQGTPGHPTASKIPSELRGSGPLSDPAHSGSAPAHVAAAALGRTRPGCGALVLVAEDDPALVEIVGTHLD